MDLGALRALVVSTNLAVHGVPAVVTRPAPDNEPIETRGIWMTPETDGEPVGSTFQRREGIRAMALSRGAVPTIPRGTVVLAREVINSAVKRWLVDGVQREEPEIWRVFVIDVTEDA